MMLRPYGVRRYPIKGLWTPVLTFATPGNVAVGYTTRYGDFQLHEGFATINAQIVTSSFTHTTASGELRITDVPYTAVNVSGYRAVGSLYWSGITKANYTQVVAFMSENSAVVRFAISGSGQALDTVDAADVPTGGLINMAFTLRFRV